MDVKEEAKDTIDFVQTYIRHLENQNNLINQIPSDLLENIQSFDHKQYIKLRRLCMKLGTRYHNIYRKALQKLRNKDQEPSEFTSGNFSHHTCESENVPPKILTLDDFTNLFTSQESENTSQEQNISKIFVETNESAGGNVSSNINNVNNEESLTQISQFKEQNTSVANKNKVNVTTINSSACSSSQLSQNSSWTGSSNQEEEDCDLLEDFDSNKSQHFSLNYQQSLLDEVGKDDRAEFQKHYHYTEILHDMLHSKFGLQAFRPLQEEIINACLSQMDCFVLMPTGGGKSLCYQLPATLTPGVTIIISPLRALIVDQVVKLNTLGVLTAHLCPNLTKDTDENAVLNALNSKEPSIKLLYLTPERIKSQKMMDVLISLYKRDKIARFVIDEAHCLSNWGHDFRPDYKRLAVLKHLFPKVPIMCLTATATKMVKEDVIKTLNLQNVKCFIKGFNRENIKYQVVKKTKEAAQDIANIIYRHFRDSCGIIYCLSRLDCEQLAKQLKSVKIKAEAYHAGMKNSEREQKQNDWMKEVVKVMVATIAFGLGIDKPNVRFVIHHTLPKSLESFYQESGRAGRDGEISHSYLFYRPGDIYSLTRLISSGVTDPKVLEGKLFNLHQMSAFCENNVDCRRYLQLKYLGENFDRKDCIARPKSVCDNCADLDKAVTVSYSVQAKELYRLIKDLSLIDSNKWTVIKIIDVYRGFVKKKQPKQYYESHPLFGKGRDMSKADIYRILKEMVYKGILIEEAPFTGTYPISFVKIGPNFGKLLQDKFMMLVQNDQQPSVRTINTENVKNQKTDDNQEEEEEEEGEIASNVLLNLQRSCHEKLLEVCQKLAMERGVTLSSIMNLSAMKKLSETMPKTKEEFLKIEYITENLFDKYGQKFLDVTKEFNKTVETTRKSAGKKRKWDEMNDDAPIIVKEKRSTRSRAGNKRKTKRTPKNTTKYKGRREKLSAKTTTKTKRLSLNSIV